jgi:hypothetical protein
MQSEQHLPEIIRLASILSVAVPLVIYLMKIRNVSKPVHLIGILTIASAIADLSVAFFFAKGQSTVIIFNIYSILLFLLLSWFYYEIFLTKKGQRTVLGGVAVYIISFILLTTTAHQSFFQYQTFLWTIAGMIMIIFSISYFLYLFSAPVTLSNFELLWINSGVLLYFSLNLFLFVMSGYVLTRLDPEISLLIWSFHNVNNIMKNVLLAFGIYAFNRVANSGFRTPSQA